MTPERSQPSRRLALVFRGAGTRWVLPAASVLEVAPAPEGPQATRNGLAVDDFGALFPSGQAHANAVTLVLDCAPPRALGVEAVEEVADLAAAPFFGLPEGLGPTGLIRGVVLHRGRLALELIPQALADYRPPSRLAAVARSLLPPEVLPARPPGRSLVLQAGELGLVGIPLALVTGVLKVEAPCPLPGAPCGHCGLVHHERSLLSLFDLAIVAGRPASGGEFAVALDVSGQALAVLATRVIGVLEGFGGEPQAEPGGVVWRARDARHVLFPQLERWVLPRPEPAAQV